MDDRIAQLRLEHLALASRREYIDITRQRLDADDRAISARIGCIDAELAALAVEEQAEAARLADAKRQHDAEVAAIKKLDEAEREFGRAEINAKPACTDEERDARIAARTLTPEEEAAAVAKLNGQPEHVEGAY